MQKSLTIILTQNAEISPKYLHYYFGALHNWNRETMSDVQIILVSQLKSSQLVNYIVSNYPYQVDIVNASHDFVGDYPIWDVVESTKRIRSLINGKYITFNHSEFIWLPGCLAATINWLKDHHLYLAVGNLRRPGSYKDVGSVFPSCSREQSDLLMGLMEQHKWDEAKEAVSTMRSIPWVFWLPEFAPGRVRWLEDVFFADVEWLDSWKWLDHGGRMPFQDIFDLLGAAVNLFERFKMSPHIYRMPKSINTMMHLWHTKNWSSWTPEIRDWFLSRDEWKGTKFHDQKLWESLVKIGTGETGSSEKPVIDIRRGPGGTVTRYINDLIAYMKNGGKSELDKFYSTHGREARLNA